MNDAIINNSNYMITILCEGKFVNTKYWDIPQLKPTEGNN